MKVRKIYEFLEIVYKISLIKTVYFSLKTKAPVLIGKGSRVYISKNSKIIIPKKGLLTVGIYFRHPSGAILEVDNGGTLRVDGRAHITHGTRVSIRVGAILKFGGNNFINENSVIDCKREISIGRDCIIGWGCNITDSDLHTIIRGGVEGRREAPVHIGDGVWLGMGVTVLKGVSIGDGAIVAAQSLVLKDVPSKALVAGSPAKIIDTDVAWKD